MYMSACLTNIQCTTTLTLMFIHNMRSNCKSHYVDDCFLIFQSKEQVIPFLDYLNSKHPNIEFTHKLENIEVHYHSLALTSHELTAASPPLCFTNLPQQGYYFTNFNSFIPMTYKKDLLLSLISRYFNICSSYQSFHSEIQNINIFFLNGYINSLSDNCIRTFLDNIFSPKPPVHSCSKKILFFCIPYASQYDLQLRTQLHKLLSRAYQHISICLVVRPACRWSDFFHLRIEFLLQ